jgi:hypothetical protein
VDAATSHFANATRVYSDPAGLLTMLKEKLPEGIFTLLVAKLQGPATAE